MRGILKVGGALVAICLCSGFAHAFEDHLYNFAVSVAEREFPHGPSEHPKKRGWCVRMATANHDIEFDSCHWSQHDITKMFAPPEVWRPIAALIRPVSEQELRGITLLPENWWWEDDTYVCWRGIPQSIYIDGLPYFRYTFRYCGYYPGLGEFGFNDAAELPPAIREVFLAEMGEPIEWLVRALPNMWRKWKEPYDPWRDIANRDREIERVEEALATGEGPVISSLGRERTQGYLEELRSGREYIRRILETGPKPTELERAAMKGYILWQETRCARMVLEGKTDEAKKDFECRSIQIRDYLQFGPKGASEEVLKERAARELAPAPPKVPWETAAQPQETTGNPQAAGSAPDGAGGIVSDGSPKHPSAVPGTGSRFTPHGSPLTNPRAQAAGVAGLVALLGALVLRRSRP